MVDQQRDVLLALPKWRQLDEHGIEQIQKIFFHGTAGNDFIQFPAGPGNQAGALPGICFRPSPIKRHHPIAHGRWKQ
jgi:hypothetical protein